MTTSDFIDDQAAVNAQITQHEIRLGIPASQPLNDIARANMILRGMELMPTPTKPAVPATAPVAPAPTKPVGSGPAATGMQRTVQAFTAGQQPIPSADLPTRHRELHGVNLVAAYYSRQAEATPSV